MTSVKLTAAPRKVAKKNPKRELPPKLTAIKGPTMVEIPIVVDIAVKRAL